MRLPLGDGHCFREQALDFNLEDLQLKLNCF